jgi:Ser/Thr protein kinase RdoA (MazF antagonist)
MDKELLEKIKIIYKIPDIVSTKKIDKGFLSENYALSTEHGDYFLKKYRFKNHDRIREIHSVKSYFNKGGIPVIMPIESVFKETFFEHNGSLFALFPFVSGLQPERGELSEKMIISLGQTLGHIHLLGKDNPIQMDDEFSGWDKAEALQTAELIEEKINQIEEKSDFDKLAQEVVAFKKRLIQRNDINFPDLKLENDHLIHGDYLDQNVFFDEEDKIKYVFDFEKTKNEPRTQELFRSATYSFLNTDFDDTSIKNIKLYVDSYLEIYPMGYEELRNGLIAHYVKSMHGFWVEKEHYLKGNNRVDLFLELNYKRLKFMFMSEKLADLFQ